MKPVLIIENSKNSLKLNESQEKDKYVLEGVFTEFDIVNRNERIYTADEFVPHVDKMMEKKKWGVIYGELDHPEIFSSSLKYVSHIVENAVFNKTANRIDGEIKLLNTTYGKEAKALVDEGLPIFVSSRAAGITESTGKVKLKQLFTYDIVDDPGFASARVSVKSMNESLGYQNDSNFFIVESNTKEMSEYSSKYDKANNSKILNLSDDSDTNDLFNMNKNDLVTKKQLSDWSKYLTSQIKENNSKIISKIQETKGSKSVNPEDKKLEDYLSYQEALEEQFQKVIEYLDYIAEKVQFTINTTEVLEKKTEDIVNYSNYLAETVENSIEFSNYLAETLDKSISYADYLAENLDKNIDYSNYLAENLDKTIDYSEYIAENLTSSIKYANYLAENLDKTIDYSEYIAENLDANIGYANYIAENLDVNIGYVQYVAENLDSTINYADYLSECVDKSLEYANSISETINKSEKDGVTINEKLLTADEFLKGLEKNKKNVTETEETSEETKPTEAVSENINAVRTIGDLRKKSIPTTPEAVIVSEEEEIAKASDMLGDTTPTDSTITEETEEDKNNFKEFINDNTSKESLTEKITKLIDEAKKREASKDVKPTFYGFLTADDVKAFENLTNDEQESIKVAINESTGYYTRNHVLSIMKQALEKGKPSAEQLLIEGIPAEIKPIWEKVDSKMKKSIISQSKFYDISNPELIEHFWSTRNFDSVTKNDKKVLLESSNPFEKLNKLSDEDIESFIEKFDKLK